MELTGIEATCRICRKDRANPTDRPAVNKAALQNKILEYLGKYPNMYNQRKFPGIQTSLNIFKLKTNKKKKY